MDAVIFDFDGVIVDSEPVHLAGFQRVLQPLGVDLSEQDYYDEYLGYDDRDCIQHVVADRGARLADGQLEALIAQKTLLVQQMFGQTIRALPGAKDLTTALAAAGVPLAICSGALRAEIALAAATVGVAEHFHCIVAAEDVAVGKPAPEGYVLARQALEQATGARLDAGRCVVVEDSPAGIDAGKAAGMAVLAVATSYESSALRAADRVVASLADVTPDDLRALAAG